MKSHVVKSEIKPPKAKNMNANHPLIDTLELPKDLFLGLPNIALEGNRSVCITNHRGLVRYSRETIVVAVKSGSIQITGRELMIPKFTRDVMEIRGYLEGVTFL